MQEQVNDKMVSLVIRGTKLTGRTLAKAIKLLLSDRRKQKQTGVKPESYKGKQTKKQLEKKGGELEEIKITDKNIKSFERVARKYKVEFAVEKDKTVSPPKWVISFRSKDERSMTLAFKEYSQSVLKKTTQKQSVLSALNKMKEMAKNLVPNKVKNKEMGAR